MAGSVNKVILVGNLGRDPETRYNPDGAAITNVSVATTSQWKDKNTGEWQERTEWHYVVVWNEHLIQTATRYIKKGTKVYVEGQMQTRKWQDQSGAERYSTEVVIPKAYAGDLQVLGKGRGKDERDDDDDEERRPMQQTRRQRQEIDDEIPF